MKFGHCCVQFFSFFSTLDNTTPSPSPPTATLRTIPYISPPRSPRCAPLSSSVPSFSSSSILMMKSCSMKLWMKFVCEMGQPPSSKENKGEKREERPIVGTRETKASPVSTLSALCRPLPAIRGNIFPLNCRNAIRCTPNARKDITHARVRLSLEIMFTSAIASRLFLVLDLVCVKALPHPAQSREVPEGQQEGWERRLRSHLRWSRALSAAPRLAVACPLRCSVQLSRPWQKGPRARQAPGACSSILALGR